MKVRLYLDEDTMDGDLVESLRVRGVDFHTALEAGMLRRADRELLDYATQQGRAVYTFNIGHFAPSTRISSEAAGTTRASWSRSNNASA